jgi:ATP:ADP antiporter, AAA family
VSNSALLKILKVESDEWPTFAQMLGHSFFNSLGIAFSFTAINVLLINLHGIELLPWIYLFGGLMVLGFGRIYAYLESRVPSVQLFAGVLLFGVSWTLMARGLTVWGDTMLMLAVLYALYLALYQLINLEFWGAAALIYDVRQSKRLFGLLSTGESVAKMGGYLATPLIVSVFSLSDLLFFAAASFGISFFFLFQLSRVNTRALDVDHDHHHGDHQVYHRKSLLARFLEIIPKIKDSYLKITGLFALFSAVVYYLVHYSFLNRVEVHFDNIDELAFFFGMFFGIGKGINLLIKVLLYSRIFNNMKIGFIILLFPLTIGVLALFGMVGQFFVADDLIFFLWVFGFIMLMDEVFRTSIYLPSFFVLFQP